MSTVVGIDCSDGALIAGDRTLVRDGRVASRQRTRVFDFETVGAAAVGGDTDAFRRRLGGELRRYRTERGEDAGIEPAAAIAARLADEIGIDAIVVARDDDGAARLRAVGRDGSAIEESLAAFGTGAELALGRLEGSAETSGLEAAESLVREAFEVIAERDAETGADADVWTLTDDR